MGDPLLKKDPLVFQVHRVTVLPDDRLAIVPRSTRPGDIICCLAGSTMAYVLRLRLVDDGYDMDENICKALGNGVLRAGTAAEDASTIMLNA